MGAHNTRLHSDTDYYDEIFHEIEAFRSSSAGSYHENGIDMDEFGIIHDDTDLFGQYEPNQTQPDSGIGADRKSSTSTTKLTEFANNFRPSQQTLEMNDSHPLDEKSLNISDFEDSTARDSLKEELALRRASFSSHEESELVFNDSRDTHASNAHKDSSHFENRFPCQNNQSDVEDLKNQGVYVEDDFSSAFGKKQDLDSLKNQGVFTDDDFYADRNYPQYLKNQGVITDDGSHPLYSHSLMEFENLEAQLNTKDNSQNLPGDDPLADFLQQTPHRDSNIAIHQELSFTDSHTVTPEPVVHRNSSVTPVRYSDVDSDLARGDLSQSSRRSRKDSFSEDLTLSESGQQNLNSTVIEKQFHDMIGKQKFEDDFQYPGDPNSYSRQSTPQPSKIPTLARRSPYSTPPRSRNTSPATLPPGVYRRSSLTPPRSSSESPDRSKSPDRGKSPARSRSPLVRLGSHFHIPNLSSRSGSPSKSLDSQGGSRHSYSSNRPRSRSGSRAATPERRDGDYASCLPSGESRSQSPEASASRRGSTEVSKILKNSIVRSSTASVNNSKRSSSVPLNPQRKTAEKSKRPNSAKFGKETKTASGSKSPGITKMKREMPKILPNRPGSPEKLRLKTAQNIGNNNSKPKPVKPDLNVNTRELMKEKSFNLSHSFSQDEDNCSLSQGSLPHSPGELSARLRQERGQRKQTDELVYQLQDEYDKLLEKYALAEVTIDHLKLGAKINLHTDPPTPAQAITGMSPSPQKAQLFNIPQSNRAHVGHIGKPAQAQVMMLQGDQQFGDSGIANLPSTFPGRHDFTHQSPSLDKISRSSDTLGFGDGDPFLTATASGEGVKIGLIFQAKSLEEQLDSFQTLLNEDQLTIDEQEKVYSRIKGDFEKLQLDYRLAKEDHDRMRRNNTIGSGGTQIFFDDDKSLEGELFKLGMKLEEVHEQVEDNLKQKTNQRKPFQEQTALRRESENNILRRPSSSSMASGTGKPGDNADQLTDLDNKVERLLDEYNRLMDRYNDLKALPPTQERDREIDILLKRVKEISDESPELLNVTLPSIPQSGHSDLELAGKQPETSQKYRDARHQNNARACNDSRSEEEMYESSAPEDRKRGGGVTKMSQRPNRLNTRQNVLGSHSSIADSGLSTPTHSRKSVPRTGSRATTDVDSGFIGSESSRQSGQPGKGKHRSRGLKPSLKSAELSSVASNQQEWSETDVSTTESVKHETEQRRAKMDKLRATQDPSYSQASGLRDSSDTARRRQLRTGTPDSERSYATQGSRASATSRSSVKSERLKQLQDEIEKLRLEVKQGKGQSDDSPTANRRNVQDRNQYSATNEGQNNIRNTAEKSKVDPLANQKYSTDQEYQMVNRLPPQHGLDEMHRSTRPNERLVGIQDDQDNWEKPREQSRYYLQQGGSPIGQKYLLQSMTNPEEDHRYANDDYFDRNQRNDYGPRKTGPHSMDRHYEDRPRNRDRDTSRYEDDPSADDYHTSQFPRQYDRHSEREKYMDNANPVNTKNFGYHPNSRLYRSKTDRNEYIPPSESRHSYKDDRYNPGERTYLRENDNYRYIPGRTRTRPRFDEQYPGETSYVDDPSFNERTPPLSRTDLASAPRYERGAGYTITKSPCPLCGGSGSHSHAEFHHVHPPQHEPPPSVRNVNYISPPQYTAPAEVAPSYSGAQYSTPQAMTNVPVTPVQPTSQSHVYHANPLVQSRHVVPAPLMQTTLPLSAGQTQYVPSQQLVQTAQPAVHTSLVQPHPIYQSTPIVQGQPVVQLPVAQNGMQSTAQPAQLLVNAGPHTYIPVELHTTPVKSSTSNISHSTTPRSKVRYYVREYEEVENPGSDIEYKIHRRSGNRSRKSKNKSLHGTVSYSEDEREIMASSYLDNSLDAATQAAKEMKELSEKMRTSLQEELMRSTIRNASLAWGPVTKY